MPQVFLYQDTQFFDDTSGAPLAGGKIWTYAAGSTTPLATYTDSTGNSLAANPVILDPAGVAAIWLTSASYKFLIENSSGATIRTIDGINIGAAANLTSSTTTTGDITMQQSTAATSLANQNSNNLKIQARYWTGAADATDIWNVQDVLGTGSNPTSTLTVTHSGSSGASQVSLPTFSGNAKTLNTILFADQFSGSDASVKINAAITAAIAAGGGVVDCRGLGGTQTMSAAIAIGNASLVPVHLILPTTCTWTWSTNLGAGVNAVSLYPKSSISGPGSGEGNPCVLKAATGFTGNSLFALIKVTSSGDYYHASGFNVHVATGTTCTTAATIITGMADASRIESIETIVDSGATCPIGMQVIASVAGSSLINVGVDANNNTGTTPVVCGDGANNLDNVNFISCSFVHPGQALPALSIIGGAFTGVLNFYGLFIELGSGYDTTTALVKIAASVSGVQNFFGGRCNANITAAANYFFDVGSASRINTYGCRIFGNSDVNGINDHNKGTITIIADANGNIAPYSSYLSPAQIAIGGGPTSTSFFNAMLTLLPDSSHRGLAISNQADAILNGIDLDSGLTAASTRVLRFLDRGTAEWGISCDGSNLFRVDDNVNNLIRLLLQQNNKTELNAGSGANVVQLNVRNGTGTSGTAFGDGAGNIRATIDGSGIISELSANGAQWIKGQASELLTLSTVGTTTDTTATLLPANSIIEAVVARVTTTITVATDWKLGDPTTAGRFSAADSTMTAGEVVVGTVQADQTGAAGPRQVAAAKVRVTTTGTPGAGIIRLTVFYRQFVGPTS